MDNLSEKFNGFVGKEEQSGDVNDLKDFKIKKEVFNEEEYSKNLMRKNTLKKDRDVSGDCHSESYGKDGIDNLKNSNLLTIATDNSTKAVRPRILPPPCLQTHHQSNYEEGAEDKQLPKGNNKNSNKTLKFKRPRILPPELDSSNDELRRVNFDNSNENVGGLIYFQTRKTREMSHSSGSGTQTAAKRGRFLVRIDNNGSRSRSCSPSRKVYVNQSLEYAKYGRKCRNFEELGYCLAGNKCPFAHGPNTIVVNDFVHPSFMSDVRPENSPSFSDPATFAAAMAAGANTVVSQIQEQTSKTLAQDVIAKKARKRTCSLLVRKIPPGCTNIAKINDYFGRFGDIQHIQVNFGGKADEALVKYTNVEAATHAYRCKEPIFSNRFVNLRWYDDGTTDNNSDAVTGPSNNEAHSTMLLPKDSFGMFATIPAENQETLISNAHLSNLSKTYGNSSNAYLLDAYNSNSNRHLAATDNFSLSGSNGAGDSVTITTASSAADSSVLAPEELLRSAQQTRNQTALRPLSKRFTTCGNKSLELKAEQERLLGAKTDLYLKLSEQIRIVLLNAKSTEDPFVRQRWLKMVDELRMNMQELGNSVRQMYAVVYPGRRALDLSTILSNNAQKQQANYQKHTQSASVHQQQPAMKQSCL